MRLHALALSLLAAPLAAAPLTIDVDLPSSSTGGGNLALRIFAPGSAAEARFAEGAPVIIYVEGGFGGGNLNPVLPQAADMVRIVFLFPGGSDPSTGRSSDGTYDNRGPACIAAVRDVVLYAAGVLPDANGQTIDAIAPAPVIHDNVGLIGSSNGGNMVLAVPATYGAGFGGALRYAIQWESPAQNQVAAAEVGGAALDCPGGGRNGLQVTNPRYIAYGAPALDVDYSQLAYDPVDPIHPVFWDGTGDGAYTTVLDPSNGCQTPDLDLDGTLTLSEDFPLSGQIDGGRHVYSRVATQEFVNRNLFGGAWPSSILTLAEATAYWDLREATVLYGPAIAAIPDLEGMVIASVDDHVQTAIDKPHVHAAFDGWAAAGAWVQLNPDPAYDIAVDPALAGRTDLPQNLPNTPPASWSAPTTYAFPEDIATAITQVAAAWQMADRAHQTPPAVFDDYVAGQGLGDPNANRVRVYDPSGAATTVDFLAYATGRWGVNVASADLDGADAEIVTGPGPGAVFGPQVRAFLRDGTAMSGVNYYAYGTLRYGVDVGAGDLDGDAHAEILSGPGPGAVFGPHVRGWNFDGGPLSPIAKISFFAYGTLRYGVNVGSGNVDGDGFAEILTAPGPGPSFSPQVRGWDYDGAAVSSIAKINFDAFAVAQYGCSVAGGDADADGFAEIAASPGPGAGPSFPSRFKGFDYDGSAIAAAPGFDVTPFTTSYGGRAGLGNVGATSGWDLLAGAGRDPAADSTVKGYSYDGAALSPLAGSFVPFGTATFGVNVASGDLGF
ncbi:MAG: hypothetical protein U0166_07040 [Acidobacteriota bacterium]